MKQIISFFLLLSFLLSACGAKSVTPTAIAVSTKNTNLGQVIYTDPSQPTEARVEDLLKRMTLDEKIGQMTQVKKYNIKNNPEYTNNFYIVSFLGGGGVVPADNTPQGWYELISKLQAAALATHLKIPLIYGIDAVHGHGNLKNATIFPHSIGLGAANDPALTEKIGRATSEEILATSIPWSFSPVVAVVQDVRWGRTYEGFSENTDIVSSLGAEYIKGMQALEASDPASQGQTIPALATAKHFIGDGATIWGSSRQNLMGEQYMLDQGNMQFPEDMVRKLLLPPYQNAVNSGAMSVMASFSSWQGTKMHAQQGLLTKVLKDELGFKGFIVSDWQAIDQIDPDYYTAVVTAINAGIDMNMVPADYVKFIDAMKQAVSNGDIPESRVDEAVRRILRVKFSLGLFEHPMPDKKYQATIRSPEHLELARQAVRESLVLLKNENNVLPLKKDTPVIFVAGEGANDIGLQSGGWTLEWQGKKGNDNAGTTIFSGLRSAVSAGTKIEFNRDGDFSEFKDSAGKPLIWMLVLSSLPKIPMRKALATALIFP